MPRKLRVLCLHSYATSANIFQAQFARAGLDIDLADLVELVFVDSPHELSGRVPPDVAGVFQPPHREWFNAKAAGTTEDGAPAHYEGLDESEAFLERLLEEQGPFDGLIGFSQGSIMASALVAMQQAGVRLQRVPPLRFVVCIGAAISRHPRHMAAMEDRVQVPSCHIIGHGDWIKEHSIALARKFYTPVIIVHPRGHVVPNLKDAHLAVLRAFLQSFLEAEGGGGGGPARREGPSLSAAAPRGAPRLEAKL